MDSSVFAELSAKAVFDGGSQGVPRSLLSGHGKRNFVGWPSAPRQPEREARAPER